MRQHAFDFDAAIEAGKVGMTRAVERADRETTPPWSEATLELLRLWVRVSFRPFTIESARVQCGATEPTDSRAWGAVTQKAIRLGYIEKTGDYAPAASSHGSPKPLYRPGRGVR